MFCDQCGAPIEPGQKFCPSCGKSFAGAPSPPPAVAAASPAGRIAGHLRILGILWIVYSVLHLLPALGMFTFGAAGMPWMHWGHGMMSPFPRFLFFGPLMAVLGGVLVLGAILGLIAGWGLLNRRPWARLLAIVLGFLLLLSVPFGTALGIYTLWVLLPAESEREYRSPVAGG